MATYPVVPKMIISNVVLFQQSHAKVGLVGKLDRYSWCITQYWLIFV